MKYVQCMTIIIVFPFIVLPHYWTTRVTHMSMAWTSLYNSSSCFVVFLPKLSKSVFEFLTWKLKVYEPCHCQDHVHVRLIQENLKNISYKTEKLASTILKSKGSLVVFKWCNAIQKT